MRFCDICGARDANNDVLSTDICGECAPRIKGVLLQFKATLDSYTDEQLERFKQYENSRRK